MADAGCKCLLVAGDISQPAHCRALVRKAVEALGKIDILVNNAAHQKSSTSIEEISDEEWELTLASNVSAMFYITKAAVPHMNKGSSIINAASINADSPSPQLLAYATLKGAILNFTAGLAQLLSEKGIRANSVAPGPVWTPLVPSTMAPEKIASRRAPCGRARKPHPLAKFVLARRLFFDRSGVDQSRQKSPRQFVRGASFHDASARKPSRTSSNVRCLAA